MRGPRRINPLDIELVQRSIIEHPGNEPWSHVDLAIYSGWQMAIDLRDGVPTAKHPISANRFDQILNQMDHHLVQQFVDEGRLAAPEKKSARSHDPAFISHVTGIPRVPTGKAASAIAAALTERANLNPDPVARKNALANVAREVDYYTSPPNERTLRFARMHEQSEASHEMWAGDRARATKLEGQVEALLASAATTQRLLENWNFMPADGPVQPTRRH